MRIRTGGMQKGFKYDRKKCWYTDGITQTQIFEGDPIPEGFTRGRLKFNKPAWNSGLNKETSAKIAKISQTKKQNKKDRVWINNKIIEKLIDKDAQPLPDGFVIGRLPRKKKNRIVNLSEFISYYETHSIAACCGKFKITLNEIKDLITLNDLEPFEEHCKRLHDLTYTPEWRKRHSEALKGKNTWSKGCKHSTEQIEKFKDSYAKRTAEDTQKSKLKEYNTRLQNGSYKKHITKEELYVQDLLLKVFDKEDIKYLYFDAVRYPYECDFYIKSLDLFIEVNAYPSHGGKAFDKNDPADIEKLNQWLYKSETEGKKQYKNWIYTWTDLDVRKQEVAKSHNLNYIPLYNILDLEEKLCEYMQNKKYKKGTM